MIIWINGTFGAGKTTTGTLLAQRDSRLRLFDPEWVGYLLANNLADHEFTDFQQLAPWRSLTPRVADELVRFTGQDLVAVQTVLDEGHWLELQLGHLATYATARTWMAARADLVLDTTHLTPEEAVDHVWKATEDRLARR